MAKMSKEALPIAARLEEDAQNEKCIEKNPVAIEIRIGHNIYKLRKARRLSQQELAKRAQVHRNYICHVERGKRNVSIVIIDRIAKALGVEIHELFD